MDGPLEVDIDGVGQDKHYVIMDRHGRVLCDTSNCYQFSIEEQKEALQDLVDTWNKSCQK